MCVLLCRPVIESKMRLSLRLVVALAALSMLFQFCLSTPLYQVRRFKKTSNEEQTQNYWKRIADEELNRAIRMKHNTNVAKNVILFLGDGMSIPTITAGRIYKGQQFSHSGEEGWLNFEQFPHVGLVKTYNVNKQVSDSASTATAYLGGVKTNYKTLGVDASAIYQKCHTVTEDNKVYSIVKWAQDAGKKTGVVTSTRITHATPAGTYAHVADRDWECDGNLPEGCDSIKDIARQLVEDEPGSLINVLMGGGYQSLNSDAIGTEDDPLDDLYGCTRLDGRNLTEDWVNAKKNSGVKYAFVRNKTQLLTVDTNNVDYLLGIFANGHLQYEHEKRDKNLNVPTLANMTKAALEILGKGPEGYFLLVEGGRIDHAHHDTMAHRALDELVAMDDAIGVAMQMTDEKNTLIVVTADHAHTMSFSGYPQRGQEIIGLAGLDEEGVGYTTLMYANGPGYNNTRPNITAEDTRDWEYTQLATVPRDSETHGGDDVAIYARGPMAHLFHGLHEQNYIPFMMAYTSCIGDYKDHCHGGAEKAVPALTLILLAISTWMLS
ncbi:alkaline phosphatase-like isoform X1 [Portunus trituberculatus]|uniref:alkaline phosphatase-like isoform X1 n=1 Tax=Portunus trituberculatus TaxID=210409 RepID=UPI001E1CC1AA|nr:alkaline phosphatase-like isoform X1 [Portunus trituberculatus]